MKDMIEEIMRRYGEILLGFHPDDEVISCYLEGSLSPEETAWVEAHLSHCSDCSEKLDFLRALAQKKKATVRNWVLGLAGAAAMTAILLLGGFYLNQRLRGPSSGEKLAKFLSETDSARISSPQNIDVVMEYLAESGVAIPESGAVTEIVVDEGLRRRIAQERSVRFAAEIHGETLFLRQGQ